MCAGRKGRKRVLRMRVGRRKSAGLPISPELGAGVCRDWVQCVRVLWYGWVTSLRHLPFCRSGRIAHHSYSPQFFSKQHWSPCSQLLCSGGSQAASSWRSCHYYSFATHHNLRGRPAGVASHQVSPLPYPPHPQVAVVPPTTPTCF